ncbi:hypothetical protein ACN38_g11772, partial [Penicillium nordicum]
LPNPHPPLHLVNSTPPGGLKIRSPPSIYGAILNSAIPEIRRYQKSTKLLIRKLPFQRLVRPGLQVRSPF